MRIITADEIAERLLADPEVRQYYEAYTRHYEALARRLHTHTHEEDIVYVPTSSPVVSPDP